MMAADRRDDVDLMPEPPGGRLLRDEPMSRHTSWRVGGPADWFYEPDDIDALGRFLRGLPASLPVVFIGLGSNLLVRDGGIRGVVIRPRKALSTFAPLGGNGLRIGAGIACARIARYCERHGLGPAAFFAGIPGTLGGALAMNAGAWGGETWQCVSAVQVVNRHGEVLERPATCYQAGYREVTRMTAHDACAPDEWFVRADLQFEPLAAPESIRSLLVRRKQSQPIGEPSCGSVFRNPPGDHAARLIEACGLKGHVIGGAQVSPQHANFIVNTGGASAADIERLMNLVRETVAERSGIALIAEVRVLGESA
jgi:UDP-N-acetylmuramate dehydrogenase